jgi:beta-galactosidase
MRNVTSLGAGWRYLPRFEDAFVDPRHQLPGWAPVDIPHTNLELPFNAFDEKSCQFVSTYARDVEIPALPDGRRAFLDFEGVMTACDVWVNGKPAGGHLGGYTPFSIEITSLAAAGTNRIVVRVDSTERSDIPPFGHVVDYLCYGGIYRGVGLRIQEAAIIKGIFARPFDALEARKSLDVEVAIDLGAAGTAGAARGLAVRARLMDGARIAAESVAPIVSAGDAGSGGSHAATIQLRGIEGLRVWDLDDPALYSLEVELLSGDAMVDIERHRIGFRTAEWRPEGFFLNGRRVVIRGLNRHQSFPWQGYAMPARVQRRDAEILKRELGVNLVRTSHYPQAKAFLDACDELGLLVLEEFPGWQHIGDATWKDNACTALREMIVRDRNRPAIVLWGVRINESKDDHDFYVRTNEIAHRLDPTRARGGIRCIDKSELLEDVYTFNDFVFDGGERVLRKPRSVTGLRRDVPYLVTEYNGHMYPTKRFDNEERLAEHARRHAAAVNAAASTKGVAGAIGWCAFDYNTHKDFGSGDRICYHGVSDMFRIPKYAAALYASQRDPAEGVVLEAACIFAKGERCAATLLPIDIYTNCDEVVLWRGGKRIGTFLPERRSWPGLRHPPVVVRDLVGDQLSDSDFSPRDRAAIRKVAGKVLTVGYQNLNLADKLAMGLLLLRNHLSLSEAEALFGKFTIGWGAKDESWELVGFVDGKEVARRRYGGDAVPSALQLRADDLHLLAKGAAGAAVWGDASTYLEGWDATRIEVRLVDQYGNIEPFAAEAIDIEVEGPGAVAGPRRFALQGGCAAFWLRTTGEPGTIRVRVRCGRFAAGELAIEAD